MKKILLQTTILIGTIVLCSSVVIAMDEDNPQATPSGVAPRTPVVEIPENSPTRHPGGLFKQDPKTHHWMVQCQACKAWLNSTRTPNEPNEKVMKSTEPAMARFHILTCKKES